MIVDKLSFCQLRKSQWVKEKICHCESSFNFQLNDLEKMLSFFSYGCLTFIFHQKHFLLQNELKAFLFSCDNYMHCSDAHDNACI